MYINHTFVLSKDATIIHSPNFETSIVKIQESRYSELSRVKLSESSSVKQDCVEVRNGVENNISFAETTMKKRRLNESRGAFMDTRFILPSSNILERLFSIAGYSLRDRRRGLLPSNFEMRLFLRANADLCGVSDVQYMLSK